jgi:trans-aconitate 2-methyltransferase
MWDPVQYQRYTGERSRPFFDLLARVGAAAPGYVADLGCGPGNLTAALAERWPGADVEGVDNSAQMLAAAERELAAYLERRGRQGRQGAGDRTWQRGRGAGGGSLSFRHGDVRDFLPGRKADVITCNAVLQWIPRHLDLLPRWTAALAPGGWLAIQVPGNHDQPSHRILRDLAASPRWRGLLADVAVTRQSDGPAGYLRVLAGAGCQVDAWETTYLHVLHGDDPVLDWYKGSGLRPVIDALTPDDAAEFLGEYAAGLRAAYPAESFGTLLPFRRVFAVARRIR